MVGNRSFKFSFLVFNQPNDAVANERRIVAVAVDLKTGRPVKTHEQLVAALERLEGSEVDDSPPKS